MGIFIDLSNAFWCSREFLFFVIYFSFFSFFTLMKNFSFVLVLAVAFVLVGCGDKPMTDADMAAQNNMSLEEYQEQKEAAARMNMDIEDHLNMGH